MFYTALKNQPKDAQVVSHSLLARAGYITQVAAGRYAFLPLGERVAQKIIDVIEKEMVSVGAQRISTPTLHPIAIWQQSNRDKAFGGEMMTVDDHHGGTFVLGATAEGLMVELVKSRAPSYRDLPIVIFQFTQKFRDEKRPRGGLLRVREFLMKDAYSFHATEEDLLAWYQKFFDAYLRIADLFDLKVIPVQADSGAIGGDYNHEFMVESSSGEDKILVCQRCGYAANVDRAASQVSATDEKTELWQPRKDIEGKGIIGVEELSSFLGISVQKTTKTMIYKTDSAEVVAVMIRGDREINEVKLKKILGAAQVVLADADTVRRVTGAEVGYAGPIGLPEEVRLVADLTCQGRVNFEAGTNRTDYHSINLNFGRDLPLPLFVDVCRAQGGDRCASCAEGILETRTAIEWGHIFNQGHFYTKPHGATYVDASGSPALLWMGAYGIGIGRSLATIVETHHDERGIIWPRSVTPFHAHLIDLARGNRTRAVEIYDACRRTGFDVLLDDRECSAGEKFAEADLIGVSVRLVVSDKTAGQIEWKERSNSKAELLTQDMLLKRLAEYYAS